MGRVWYWVDHTAGFEGNSGIQRVARSLAAALQQRGYDLQFVCWDRSRSAIVPLNESQLRNLSRWSGPESYSEQIGLLAPPIRDGWLLIPELMTYAGAPDIRQVMHQARRSGLKVAAIFFDAIPYKLREHYSAARASLHAEYMATIAEADAVLAISDTARSDLLEYLYRHRERAAGLERKILSVPLAGEFPGSRRSVAPGQSDGVVTVLCVATVEPRKNHALLLEAFRRAANAVDRPMRLVIIGANPFADLEGRLMEAIDGDARIVWIKNADQETLAKHYGACSFTVYPSVEEGFGLPILESLWYAKPSICHNRSAMAELVPGGGCLAVNMEDVAEIEAAIVRVVRDAQLYERLGREAASRKIKTWNEYAEEVIGELRRLAGPRSIAGDPSTQSVPTPARPHTAPLLSLCISTYNRADWLDVSLRSALKRTEAFADVVEVLVVDNASTDHTSEVAQRYAGPHLRYERNRVNVGMLGNLKVTADLAKGEYIWIIGDDDIVMPAAVERILWAIATLHEIPLIYLNYAYTRLDDPAAIKDVAIVYESAIPVSSENRDELADQVHRIAARSENCFTAIYTCVFRRDHAIAAYSIDTSGAPFSSLATCVPSSVHVVEKMFHGPGLWLGQPCITVNMNVSWGRYAPLFVLERLPELYDIMEARGTSSVELDKIRERNVPGVLHFLGLLFDGQVPHAAPAISFENVLRRFKHLAEFRDRVPELLKAYDKARLSGKISASLPDGGMLAKKYGLA
jgi:glycosyltransferase involved in cell wall biosynthesis